MDTLLRTTLEAVLAAVIRKEIVRQYRDDERSKCPGGAHYYEEHIAPWLIAKCVIAALDRVLDAPVD